MWEIPAIQKTQMSRLGRAQEEAWWSLEGLFKDPAPLLPDGSAGFISLSPFSLTSHDCPQYFFPFRQTDLCFSTPVSLCALPISLD